MSYAVALSNRRNVCSARTFYNSRNSDASTISVKGESSLWHKHQSYIPLKQHIGKATIKVGISKYIFEWLEIPLALFAQYNSFPGFYNYQILEHNFYYASLSKLPHCSESIFHLGIRHYNNEGYLIRCLNESKHLKF